MKFPRSQAPAPFLKVLYPVSLFNIFLLLLAFVVLSPTMMRPSGLTVALPYAISSEPVSQDGFVISILKDNALYLGSRAVTFDELKRFVSARQGRDFKVLIKADRQADIGTLISIWDLLRQAGSAKVYIATNE